MQEEFELVSNRWFKRWNWVTMGAALFISHFSYYFLEGMLAFIFLIGSLCFSALIFTLVTVIPCRKEIPSREYCFKKYYDLWCLWYTGRETLRLKLIQKYPDRVKKLLLPNPESDGFQKNMRETSGHGQSSKDNILRLTEIAQSYNIPVKWYDFFQPQTMTFYDSKSLRNAWLLVTDAQKYADVDARPKRKYTKKDKSGEYDDKLDSFNEIWDNRSHEPNIQEGDTDSEKGRFQA